MNVYRLDPIEPGDPSWKASIEYDSVWACAPSPEDARALVARKTRTDPEAPRFDSPWLDSAVTSCVPQPTMHLMDAETVLRADGSPVGG